MALQFEFWCSYGKVCLNLIYKRAFLKLFIGKGVDICYRICHFEQKSSISWFKGKYFFPLREEKKLYHFNDTHILSHLVHDFRQCLHYDDITIYLAILLFQFSGPWDVHKVKLRVSHGLWQVSRPCLISRFL